MTDLPLLLVPALALALLHFLWQGALVGLLAWSALALLRNARPQARYAVACLALLACAALPALDLMLGLRGSGLAWSSLATHNDAATASAIPLPDLISSRMLAPSSNESLAWIVALWAAGAALLLLRMAMGMLWVQRLCAGASTETSQQMQACVDRLARRFDIRRPVGLRIVASGDSPVSAGWWRPMILVPAAVLARMPADLLEALLAHELAHVRRHDYLVNLLQSAVEAVLFYHPVVWWLSHRIRVERELIADGLAAEVLGERRRLAIALSELDRTNALQPLFPHPQLAQAAHGGHLMSRIQHLLRPQRQRIGATFALPLLGLLAASIAVYAHARQQPQQQPVAPASVEPAATPVPAATSATLPSPLPVAQRSSGPVTAPAMPAVSTRNKLLAHGGSNHSSYALVRKGREGFSMSGSTDDVDDIRRARQGIDGDFLWLRSNGKAYVIRDAGVLARVEKAWQPTEALDAQMRVLDQRMQPHHLKMEALQARMESRQAAIDEPVAMRESQERMEALGREMESLGRRQEALSRQVSNAGEARREAAERRAEALRSEQEALAGQMEQHSREMEAAGRKMERMHAPIEAIGREMEAAARPMEAIGKQMESLGSQIEHEANLADRVIREEIATAMQRGLAMPEPNRQ